MERPKMVCCNFFSDNNQLKDFTFEHGFDGVEWTFTAESLPRTPAQESCLVRTIEALSPLEVRYHAALKKTDPGHARTEQAREADQLMKRVCRLVADLGGRYMTVHVGLGHDSTYDLSWDRTVAGLTELTAYAENLDLKICLENLAWGWTSKPHLFEKLIRKSGCRATLDIGHARMSPAVTSGQYDLEDFVAPHPERFLSAHIYHEELNHTHIPPRGLDDVADRIKILWRLPQCHWWVLELRDQKNLLATLGVMREYFRLKFDLDIGQEDFPASTSTSA